MTKPGLTTYQQSFRLPSHRQQSYRLFEVKE
jgi:hypothetical protein